MNIRKKQRDAARKAEVMCAESLSAYVGKVAGSATEGFDEATQLPANTEKAESVLKSIVAENVVSVILQCDIFFTHNAEVALDEYIGILGDPDVRKHVVEQLAADYEGRISSFEPGSPDAIRYDDASRYGRAFNQYEDMRLATEAARENLERMHDEIEARSPGALWLYEPLSEEEHAYIDKCSEGTRARREARRLELMKK